MKLFYTDMLSSESELDRALHSDSHWENMTTVVPATITTVESSGSGDPLPVHLICVLLSMIIVVGVIGNTINVVVFSRKTMRSTSTFRFLLYLSLFDMMVLLVCSTEALIEFGFDFEVCFQTNVYFFLL
jgi:predicted membrane channel-forming protein YqfA (hemolysin III family)